MIDAGRDLAAPGDLASAIEAIAHGHVTLLLGDDQDPAGEAAELVAERAVRATLALIESRHLLNQPAAQSMGRG